MTAKLRIQELTLAEISPQVLRKKSNSQLRGLILRHHQWWGNPSINREDVVNAWIFTLQEFIRRDLKVKLDPKTDLMKATRELLTEKKNKKLLDAFFRESAHPIKTRKKKKQSDILGSDRIKAAGSCLVPFVYIPDFVAVTGSFIYHSQEHRPNDLDIVIRRVDRWSVLESKLEPVLQKAVGKLGVQFIYESRGPNWDWCGLYDLILKPREGFAESNPVLFHTNPDGKTINDIEALSGFVKNIPDELALIENYAAIGGDFFSEGDSVTCWIDEDRDPMAWVKLQRQLVRATDRIPSYVSGTPKKGEAVLFFDLVLRKKSPTLHSIEEAGFKSQFYASFHEQQKQGTHPHPHGADGVHDHPGLPPATGGHPHDEKNLLGLHRHQPGDPLEGAHPNEGDGAHTHPLAQMRSQEAFHIQGTHWVKPRGDGSCPGNFPEKIDTGRTGTRCFIPSAAKAFKIAKGLREEKKPDDSIAAARRTVQDRTDTSGESWAERAARFTTSRISLGWSRLTESDRVQVWARNLADYVSIDPINGGVELARDWFQSRGFVHAAKAVHVLEQAKPPTREQQVKALEKAVGDWYMVTQPGGAKVFPFVLQEHIRGILSPDQRKAARAELATIRKMDKDKVQRAFEAWFRKNGLAVLKDNFETLKGRAQSAADTAKDVSAAIKKSLQDKPPQQREFDRINADNRIVTQGNSHSDFRIRHPSGDFLLGWTNSTPGAVIQFLNTGKIQDVTRNEFSKNVPKEGGEGDNIVAFKKATQPLPWLTLVTRESPTFVAEPGEVGATKETSGMFRLIMNGRLVFGVQKSDFHEYFLFVDSPGNLKGLSGRWGWSLIRPKKELAKVPLKQFWIGNRPGDQRPFVFKNDFEKEVAQGKRERVDLIWNHEAVEALEKMGYFRSKGLVKEFNDWKESARGVKPKKQEVFVLPKRKPKLPAIDELTD